MRASRVLGAACWPLHPGRTEQRLTRSRAPRVVCMCWAWAWVGLSRGGSWFPRGGVLPIPWASTDPFFGVVWRPMCIERTWPPKPCSVGRGPIPVRVGSVGMGSPRDSSWFSRGGSLSNLPCSRALVLEKWLRALALFSGQASVPVPSPRAVARRPRRPPASRPGSRWSHIHRARRLALPSMAWVPLLPLSALVSGPEKGLVWAAYRCLSASSWSMALSLAVGRLATMVAWIWRVFLRPCACPWILRLFGVQLAMMGSRRAELRAVVEVSAAVWMSLPSAVAFP